MSKRKSTHHQKNHTEASGGMTDLWYNFRMTEAGKTHWAFSYSPVS